MSVPSTLMAVLKFALTQMDHIHVVAELGTDWLLINTPVKVYIYTVKHLLKLHIT